MSTECKQVAKYLDVIGSSSLFHNLRHNFSFSAAIADYYYDAAKPKRSKITRRRRSGSRSVHILKQANFHIKLWKFKELILLLFYFAYSQLVRSQSSITFHRIWPYDLCRIFYTFNRHQCSLVWSAQCIVQSLFVYLYALVCTDFVGRRMEMKVCIRRWQ